MTKAVAPARAQDGYHRPAWPAAQWRVPNPATRVVLWAALVAVGTGGLWMLLPATGVDLSAQVAHADFARDHPFSPVDFRWFGGVLPFGYSLWTPPVMAVLGVRVTGWLAEIAGVALFTRLVQRTGGPHPLLGGVAAAFTFTVNLVEGRITFACAVAFGLAALVLLSPSPPAAEGRRQPNAGASGHVPARGSRTNRRRVAAGACAFAAGAASPVATLFLLVGVGALVLRGRIADAAALAVSLLPLLIISVLFADGGDESFGGRDARQALLATAVVFVVLPWRAVILRIGATIAFAMVVVVKIASTPIGSNATRLTLLFALPVVAAYVGRRWFVPVAMIAVLVVQWPIAMSRFTDRGIPISNASYFRPLVAQLHALGPVTGRVEVPETFYHWDAAYLARSVPLARGWLRQVDRKLNGAVLYHGIPTSTNYQSFLRRNAVQYVALANTRLTTWGRWERTLVTSGVPYLNEVWQNADWTLYAVRDPTPIVATPARLVRYTAGGIVLRAPAGADVAVSIRWWRWLTVHGPAGSCLRGSGAGVVLHTQASGQYTITSTLFGQSRRC